MLSSPTLWRGCGVLGVTGLVLAAGCGSRSAIYCVDESCAEPGSSGDGQAGADGGGGAGGDSYPVGRGGNSPPTDGQVIPADASVPRDGAADAKRPDGSPIDANRFDGPLSDSRADARPDVAWLDGSPRFDGSFVDAPPDSAVVPDGSACSSREICGNRVDDDCNGLADCKDSTCAADPQCTVIWRETCDNGVDDDGNWLADCADPACAGFPGCFVLGTEVCNNGIDDDADGLVDCADPACVNQSWCTATSAEVCGNGVDDNGDGLADCADPKCAALPACLTSGCAAEVDFGLVKARGANVTRGISTVGAVSSFQTCAVPGGTGRVARFDLEETTDLRIDFTQGSASAHVIAVYRAGGHQLCDQNPVRCLKPGQDTSATYTLSALEAGTYWLIVQSYPYTQGPTTVTLSTGSPSQNEICSNGADDDGDGLIDCADGTCRTESVCATSQCVPDINVGALVVDGPSSDRVYFDTTGRANRYHPDCAGTSTAGDYAVRFTLKQPAGVVANWSQQGSHVLSLFKMTGPGLACDASKNRIGCFYSGGDSPVRFVWTSLPAGDYVVITKAIGASDEGGSSMSLYAFGNRDVESCGNNIDDDGNDLVDCDDPACFGVGRCLSTMCIPDEDLGHLALGMSITRTVNTVGASDLYRTKCGHGDGPERVLRLTLDQPMGLHIQCGGTGDNVLQLAPQLRPLNACDAQLMLCADPSSMRCNFTAVNLQPGQYNLIVEAFRSGTEGSTRITLTGVSDAAPEVCNNGVDDDADGYTDCQDLKCVALPVCSNHRCDPDKSRLLSLDGKPLEVTLETSGQGDDQQVACANASGGQDAVVAIQVPTAADLTISWAQGGNHALALYANESDFLACDGGRLLECRQTGGAQFGSYQLNGVPAGSYYLVADAVEPGAEGGIILEISGVPSLH